MTIMRGKIEAIGAVSDFNVIKCKGVVRNGAEEEFSSGGNVVVPAEQAIELGLDYDVTNLKPEGFVGLPQANWTIGVTVREISPDDNPIGCDKNIISWSTTHGAAKRLVNVGAVNEERRFRIKLWANQKGAFMPSDPPQSSW